jgi:hypothetical protein
MGSIGQQTTGTFTVQVKQKLANLRQLPFQSRLRFVSKLSASELIRPMTLANAAAAPGMSHQGSIHTQEYSSTSETISVLGPPVKRRRETILLLRVELAPPFEIDTQCLTAWPPLFTENEQQIDALLVKAGGSNGGRCLEMPP